MVGKRVQFDAETWEAIEAVMSRDGLSFQELIDEAFSLWPDCNRSTLLTTKPLRFCRILGDAMLLSMWGNSDATGGGSAYAFRVGGCSDITASIASQVSASN
jgi:hypothetical protein